VAQRREIEILIDEETGEVTMDATGFKGKACEETLNKIQADLRGHKLNSVKKPEYTQKVIEIDKLKVKNATRYK